MKYLPIRDLEVVTSALNFNTSDCHIHGGCDIYTTKTTGSEKKLYKYVDSNLESQYESLLRLSAHLSSSSPNENFRVNLSRQSPFGSLAEAANRRTFAHLISTLNASHPDYEFSQITKTSDFVRARSLQTAIAAVDDALYHLRPRGSGASPMYPTSGFTSSGIQTPGGSPTWGPRMWRLIDKEMSLKECEIYHYAPDSDPFDGEEAALWTLNYFFYHKARKRVCYIYIRSHSIQSHSPTRVPRTPTTVRSSSKRPRPVSASLSATSFGASKRAKYWLGDRVADDYDVVGSWDEDDYGNDEDILGHQPGDDEVDADDEGFESDTSLRGLGFSDSEFEAEEDELEKRITAKGKVRQMSEHIAESMEV